MIYAAQHSIAASESAGVRGECPSNLDHTTLLPYQIGEIPSGADSCGPWVLTRKPKVGKGKASITCRPVDQERREIVLSDLLPEQLNARQARNHRRSVMRSRTLLMDYVQEYHLCYLWTLTYKGAGQHDWFAMTEDVRRFQERWLAKYGQLPYVIVPEWHPGGHGLHLHMGVNTFVPWQIVLALWTDAGRHLLAGTVKAPKFAKGKIDSGSCAKYLAKYVTKTLNDAGAMAHGDPIKGAHRFYKPHGQVVTIIRERFRTEVQAYHHAVSFYGGELPAQEWDSRDAEDWEGPPVRVLDWNPARARAG